jgi:trigger factor
MSPADKTKSGGQVEADDTENAGEEPEKRKLELHVDIKDAGPCKKHVRVRIPRAEIDRFYEETVKTLAERTAIPGFRPGHVPEKLVEKRFRTELANDV